MYGAQKIQNNAIYKYVTKCAQFWLKFYYLAVKCIIDLFSLLLLVIYDFAHFLVIHR